MNLLVKILILVLVGLACGLFLVVLIKPNVSIFERPSDVSMPTEQEVKILFVGDVMLGRKVETYMNEFGTMYPFASSTELFMGFNEVFANLEGTIPTEHVPTPYFTFKFSFKESVADALRQAGVTIVSLANNHGWDYGRAGFENTVAVLTESGITPTGHPVSEGMAHVGMRKVGTKNIIIPAFNATFGSFSLPLAETTIRELRETYPNDHIFVSMHWGNEYVRASSVTQETIAHTLIDAGADAVFGHHPHVVQNVEIYKGKLIAYSLGNFIFDQYFSKDVEQGLGIGVTIQGNVLEYEFIPFQSSRSRPQPMQGEEKAEFLQELARLSFDPLGEFASFYKAVTSGTITLTK